MGWRAVVMVRRAVVRGSTAVCIAATIASAQRGRVVTGIVTDTDDRPVPAATLELVGGSMATTDDSGRFRLQISHRNAASIDVHRVGFRRSRFGLLPGGDTAISVMMLPVPRELATVEVKAKEVDKTMDITGFNQRLLDHEHGINTGYFITAADIERVKPTQMSQMFEELPGVKVCRASFNQTCGLIGNHLVPSSDGHGGHNMVYCRMTVYLDGHRLNNLQSANSDSDIDTYVLPAAVAGVEYYPSGVRIPEKYSLLNGSCGLVLVWTRRGT
jgi:hypothetical protein